MIRRRTSRGFTLIELVASAALTAMLTAALMGIVWSAVRQSTQLKKSAGWRSPTTQLVSQLRLDFQNARGMSFTPTQVTLNGFLDQDSRTGLPTMLPATVRYQRIDVGGKQLLVRQSDGPGGASRRVMWIGCERLVIDPLDVTSAEDELAAHSAAGGLPSVPATFRVLLIGDQGKTLWREVIHHHEP